MHPMKAVRPGTGRYLPAAGGLAAVLGTLLAGCTPGKAYDLVGLWESRHPASTDTLYTTYYNDHLASIAEDGFSDRGVAAWLPCAGALAGPDGEAPRERSARFPDVPPGDAHEPSRYARGYRAPMDFACERPPGAVPLYGLHKGSPESDHVYTASADEARALTSRGYAFRRVEGYVFAQPVKDSVPLYRLRKGDPMAGGDVEHRYTISANARRSLLESGWTDEGVAGHVFASYVNPSVRATGYEGTFNGRRVSPDSATTIPIRNVVPDRGTFVLGGNSGSHQYGAWASNVTRRPEGAAWQRISFKLYTGNIFDDASSLNHIPVFLHYASAASRTQLSALPPYDGIAMVIARTGLNGLDCGAPRGGGQLYIEIGQAMGMSCASNLAEPMRRGTWYSIAYALSDAADVRLQVVETVTGRRLKFMDGGETFSRSFLSYYSCPLSPAQGRVGADDTFCDNPYSVHGFPVRNTGYMLFPLFDPPSDVSARLSELTVEWLDADMNVLK